MGGLVRQGENHPAFTELSLTGITHSVLKVDARDLEKGAGWVERSGPPKRNCGKGEGGEASRCERRLYKKREI